MEYIGGGKKPLAGRCSGDTEAEFEPLDGDPIESRGTEGLELSFEAPVENTNLTFLRSSWDDQGRFYRPGEGKIRLDGQEYSAKVSLLDMAVFDTPFKRHHAAFPTTKRVITEIIPDPDTPPDCIVPIFPGWGETTAQFEGDFLQILLQSVKTKGYKNPKIVGINLCGKGTEDWMQNKNKISRIGLEDEMRDAKYMAQFLGEKGVLGLEEVEVMPVAHSMGYMHMMAFVESLQGMKEVEGVRVETRKGVKRVLAINPATDQPFGAVRGKFLWRVKKYVGPALWQTLKSKGCLEVTDKSHQNMMFGGEKFADHEHFKRGVPDSAKTFLEWTLNSRRRFEDSIKPGGSMDRVTLHIYSAANDRLLPDGMAKELRSRIQGTVWGVAAGKFFIDPAAYHSIPFANMPEEQRKNLLGFIAAA